MKTLWVKILLLCFVVMLIYQHNYVYIISTSAYIGFVCHGQVIILYSWILCHIKLCKLGSHRASDFFRWTNVSRLLGDKCLVCEITQIFSEHSPSSPRCSPLLANVLYVRRTFSPQILEMCKIPTIIRRPDILTQSCCFPQIFTKWSKTIGWVRQMYVCRQLPTVCKFVIKNMKLGYSWRIFGN